MNGLLIKKIEESGFKKAHLAKKIGVEPNYLYMCIAGTRNLSTEKEEKLKELVK